MDQLRARDELIEVLTAARVLLAQEDNEFMWSSWEDVPGALQEIDEILAEIGAGTVPIGQIRSVFAPTGPMQEVSVSSGWGERFLALADRSDLALAALRTFATFACAVCGEEAGAIQLEGLPGCAELRRRSFTGVLTAPAPASSAITERLRAAIGACDARAIHELDFELAPFYCPDCDASYCGAHWQRWDVFDEDDPTWHDSIRGRCPSGHERMLED